eukprot:m51a1_g1963 hypothetical protein (556) ;mRNA; f:1074401-1076305
MAANCAPCTAAGAATALAAVALLLALARAAAAQPSELCAACVRNRTRSSWCAGDLHCVPRCPGRSELTSTRCLTGLAESCPAAPSGCAVVEGVRDGSFEAGLGGPWHMRSFRLGLIMTVEEAVSSAQGLTLSAEQMTLDGDWLAWFGGVEWATTQSLRQEGVVVPQTATHLSFWAVANILYGSRLWVTIDGRYVFVLSKMNMESQPFWTPVLADVRRFADGQQHTLMIEWFGVATKGATDYAFVDLVQLVSLPSLASSSPPNAADTSSTCSYGCLSTLGSQCDPECNNAQCGFDRGQCVADNKLGQSCYDAVKPVPLASLDSCPWYRKSTCCVKPETRDWVASTIAALQNSSAPCGGLSRNCMNELHDIMCAACSPRTGLYYEVDVLHLCPDYAASLWIACRYEELWNTKERKCLNMNITYGGQDDFIAVWGTTTPTSIGTCFAGHQEDVGKDEDDDNKTGVIVGSVVGSVGGALLIAACVAVVVAVVVRRRRNNRSQRELEMYPDHANAVDQSQSNVFTTAGPMMPVIVDNVIVQDESGNTSVLPVVCPAVIVP